MQFTAPLALIQPAGHGSHALLSDAVRAANSYWPARQISHTNWISSALVVQPAGHAPQNASPPNVNQSSGHTWHTSPAPSNFPGLQAAHAELLASGTVPFPHTRHPSEPYAATSPNAQATHSSRVGGFARRPGAHFWHAAWALTVTSPAPQMVQFMPPPGEMYATGHASHRFVAAFSNFPPTHGLQIIGSPISLVVNPSPQRTQAVAPVVAM